MFIRRLIAAMLLLHLLYHSEARSEVDPPAKIAKPSCTAALLWRGLQSERIC